MNDKRETVVEKVRKLMNKAGSTESAEEAEAFFAKAQELQTRWQIESAELADATSNDIGSTQWIVPEPYGKAKAHAFAVVGRVNDVVVQWSSTAYRNADGRRQRTLYMWGTEANLDFTEDLLAAMVVQLATLLPKVHGEKATPWSYAIGTQRARDEFIVGYGAGVAAKIRAARETVIEVKADSSTALVLASQWDRANAEARPVKTEEIRHGSQGGYAAGMKADIGQSTLDG